MTRVSAMSQLARIPRDYLRPDGHLVKAHLVIHDVERVGIGSGLRFHVDTVVLVHRTLAEDDPVVRAVEADLHLHVGLATHHVQALDVRHVPWPLHIPEVHIVLSGSYRANEDGYEVFEPHGEAGAAFSLGLLHPNVPARRIEYQ